MKFYDISKSISCNFVRMKFDNLTRLNFEKMAAMTAWGGHNVMQFRAHGLTDDSHITILSCNLVHTRSDWTKNTRIHSTCDPQFRAHFVQFRARMKFARIAGFVWIRWILLIFHHSGFLCLICCLHADFGFRTTKRTKTNKNAQRAAERIKSFVNA